MGADDSILVLYAVSAVMAFAAAFLPGSSILGRLLCVATGAAVVAWPASIYVLASWYPLSPVVGAVPVILVLYAALTVRQYLIRRACRPDNLPTLRPVSQVVDDRRRSGRRALPGEFGGIPVNQLPPRHDPWAALYGSVERDLMRGTAGRHRSYQTAPAETTRMPAASEAHQAAFAAIQAYAERQEDLPADSASRPLGDVTGQTRFDLFRGQDWPER